MQMTYKYESGVFFPLHITRPSNADASYRCWQWMVW